MIPIGMGTGGAAPLSSKDKEKKLLKAAETLFAAKDYRGCVAELDALVQAGGAPVDMHRLYAEALYKQKKYEEALPSFAECLRTWSVDTPISFFQMARSAAGKALDDAGAIAFWRQCSDTSSVVFERARAGLLAGDFAGAAGLFMTGTATIFANVEERAAWEQSFAFLLEALKNKTVAPYHYEPRTVRKFIVSGLGWSGSGAVYDYLREFSEVQAIPGETRFLEGGTGIKQILSAASRPDLFPEAVINFFFFSLLGYAEMTHHSAFKSLRFARKFMASKYARLYAENVTCIAYLLARCLAECDDKKALDTNLAHLVNETTNRIVVGPDFDTGKIALLDNVIHISKIKLAPHIDDLDIFCTFRDPRSNYAALIAEHSGFDSDIDEFISGFAARLPKMNASITRAQKSVRKGSHTTIHRVQFEEFVLSESYRLSLARSLGLKVSDQKKHSRFKPWESMRNVILHQTYDKPEEIKKIEDALGDYCYEPSVIKMNELG